MMATKSRASSFLRVFLATFVGLLMMVIIVNAAMDPYLMMPAGISLIARDHPAKTIASYRVSKAFDVMKLKPKAILLGSSRVESGLRAQDVTNLLGIDCYNLALSGANFEEMYAYFKHAHFHQPDLKLVIMCLDLFGFNQHRPPRPDFLASRLGCPHVLLSEYCRALLTKSAWKASQETLKKLFCLYRSQKIPKYWILDDRGNFTEESWDAMTEEANRPFEEKERIALADLFTSPEVYGKFELSEDALDLLRKMVATCHECGIELKVFFPPAHMVYWYGLRQKGLEGALRRLKLEVVKLTDVWDFSGPNRVTTEPFFALREGNYLDSSHFRPKIGKQLLHILFGGIKEPIFGKLLTSTTVEDHLNAMEQDFSDWTLADPGATDFVDKRCIPKKHEKLHLAQPTFRVFGYPIGCL